jgi:hypothetical protein
MYVRDYNYDQVSSFMAGVDFACGGDLLNGFRKWIRDTYRISSPMAWMVLCSEIIDKQMDTSQPEFPRRKVDAFLDMVESFLATEVD